MKKNDLRTGMTLVNAKGEVMMVLLNNMLSTFSGDGRDTVMYEEGMWGELSSFNMNLTKDHTPGLDIVEVYKGSISSPFQKTDLIWKRAKVVEELTLSEVCKELGRDVKIVKG